MRNKSALSDYWAVEDAAALAGVTRQRLNELLRLGRYPSIAVPFRPARDDTKGRSRNVRFRILTTETVERIRRDRRSAAEDQAEANARAAQKRRERAHAPAPKRGRPRKPTPHLDAVKAGRKPSVSLNGLPI